MSCRWGGWEIWPNPAGDSGLEPGRVKEKKGKKKSGVTRQTRQDPVKNPVATR